MDEKKIDSKGIIGTIVFHAILVVILFAFAFTPPKQEFPEPDGIQVNFGELVAGDDVIGEPLPEDVMNKPEIEQIDNTSSPIDENVITQNTIDAPTIKKTTKPTEVKPELTPEQKEKLRKEEEIKKQLQALTNKNFSGTGGNGGTTTGKQGNSINGTGTGPVGNPNGGYSLNTRGYSSKNPFGNGDAVHFEKPLNTLNCNKLVTLYVKINSEGKVISIIRPETAESDQDCIDAAYKAAKKTTYKPDASVEVRYGKIIYDYTTSKQ